MLKKGVYARRAMLALVCGIVADATAVGANSYLLIKVNIGYVRQNYAFAINQPVEPRTFHERIKYKRAVEEGDKNGFLKFNLHSTSKYFRPEQNGYVKVGFFDVKVDWPSVKPLLPKASLMAKAGRLFGMQKSLALNVNDLEVPITPGKWMLIKKSPGETHIKFSVKSGPRKEMKRAVGQPITLGGDSEKMLWLRPNQVAVLEYWAHGYVKNNGELRVVPQKANRFGGTCKPPDGQNPCGLEVSIGLEWRNFVQDEEDRLKKLPRKMDFDSAMDRYLEDGLVRIRLED